MWVLRKTSARNDTSESLSLWLKQNPPGSPERERFERYHGDNGAGR